MLFLSTTEKTPIEEATAGLPFDQSMVIGVIAIIAVIFIIIGLIKKTLWICVVAAVIAAVLGFANPEAITDFKDKIVSTFNQVVEPMKDTNYSELIGDDVFDGLKQEIEGLEGDKDSENNDK